MPFTPHTPDDDQSAATVWLPWVTRLAVALLAGVPIGFALLDRDEQGAVLEMALELVPVGGRA